MSLKIQVVCRKIYTSFLRDYASGTCSASDCKWNWVETCCEG